MRGEDELSMGTGATEQGPDLSGRGRQICGLLTRLRAEIHETLGVRAQPLDFLLSGLARSLTQLAPEAAEALLRDLPPAGVRAADSVDGLHLLVNRLEDVLLNETRGLDLPAPDSAKPGGTTR